MTAKKRELPSHEAVPFFVTKNLIASEARAAPHIRP